MSPGLWGHMDTVPACWGSLGTATHHPLPLMSTSSTARPQQGMAEHLGVLESGHSISQLTERAPWAAEWEPQCYLLCAWL